MGGWCWWFILYYVLLIRSIWQVDWTLKQRLKDVVNWQQRSKRTVTTAQAGGSGTKRGNQNMWDSQEKMALVEQQKVLLGRIEELGWPIREGTFYCCSERIWTFVSSSSVWTLFGEKSIAMISYSSFVLECSCPLWTLFWIFALKSRFNEPSRAAMVLR